MNITKRLMKIKMKTSVMMLSHTLMTMVLGVGLLSGVAHGQELKIDFSQDTDEPLQSGWEGFSSGTDNGTPVVKTYSSLLATDGTVEVTVQGQSHWRDYAAITGGDFEYLSDLLSDEVLHNSGGTITITLADLKPGMYSMTTYHHASDNGGSTTYDLKLTDANGTDQVIAEGMQSSLGTSPSSINTQRFDVVVNGSSDDVLIKVGPGGASGNHLVVNGFELSKAEAEAGILIYGLAASNITATAASLHATVNTNLTASTLVWDIEDMGTTNLSAWSGTNSLGTQSAGPVTGSATNLSADTGYVFRFYGEDGTTNGWSLAGSFATALSAGQAPVFTSAASTYNSVTLNWTDNAANETGYILRRATDADGPFAVVTELAADTTSHIDTGVSASTTYYYQLAATNSVNGSSTDFALCATNVTTAASPIFWSGLAASAITASSATLSAEMSGNDGNVTAYWTTNTVTDPATEAWGASDGPAAESAGTVTRTASGLLADTQYSYAFYGVNSTDGVEAWSEVATFPSGLSAAQTPAFTAVEATSSGTLSVSFEWTDNASTETAYVLERSSSGSAGPYDVVATLPANSTSHVDYVMPSTTYHYRLFATNSVNASGTDPAACQSEAITTPSAGYADGGNRFAIYNENGTNFVAHIFTEDGEFVPEAELEVEYLIVAGGGGGASTRNNTGRAGGGGGAGGLLQGSTNLMAMSYQITVGAGGAGGAGGEAAAAPNGQPSSAFSRTADGGGGGGNNVNPDGRDGGSGGGAGSPGTVGGTATPGQGHDGASSGTTGENRGGGGGGAGSAGVAGNSGGAGGDGLALSIAGSTLTYAQGGAGGSTGAKVTEDALPAPANTGNGGLGVCPEAANAYAGGAGGSGIVVIRYALPPSGTVFILQ